MFSKNNRKVARILVHAFLRCQGNCGGRLQLDLGGFQEQGPPDLPSRDQRPTPHFRNFPILIWAGLWNSFLFIVEENNLPRSFCSRLASRAAGSYTAPGMW